jgi:hypothetical protein
MLVNGKMQQKIPVFFSCLLKAFQLSNSLPPKTNIGKKTSLNLNLTSSNGNQLKSRNTTANTIANDKDALFRKLHHLFNLNKITKNIVKLLMVKSSASHLKTEISKLF